MTWREAFLKQARSDFKVMDQLAKSEVELCHRLHYLQMGTEKLARGWRIRANSTEKPAMTHVALVRLLQQLKAEQWIGRRVGYKDNRVFRHFIDRLLDTARKVQNLVPSQAGYDQPNPEYPWQDHGTVSIHAPAGYSFEDFDLEGLKLIQLERLLRALLRIAE